MSKTLKKLKKMSRGLGKSFGKTPLAKAARTPPKLRRY